MITKFKLFESWETGVPEIGDTVAVVIKDQGSLPEGAFEYINKQNLFIIKGVKKRESRSYLIDIGYTSDTNNEPYLYNLNRFVIINPNGGNKVDYEPIKIINEFKEKIDGMLKVIDILYRKISKGYDDLELYGNSDKFYEEFSILITMTADYVEEFRKLFIFYIAHEIAFDDILVSKFRDLKDIIDGLVSEITEEKKERINSVIKTSDVNYITGTVNVLKTLLERKGFKI